jgi:hypothetical protein
LGEADGGLLKVFEGIGAEKFEAVKARLIAERVNDLLNNSNLDQKILERIYGDDAKGNQIDPIKETSDILDATKHLENDPEYAKVKAHLDKYNKAMLDILAKSGIISEQAKDDWGQFASYVPLNRVFTEEQNPDVHDSNFFASPSKISGPKKFKGSGGHPIGDPIDNLIKNYAFLLNQSLRNVAYKKLYNDAYGMNVLVGEMVPPKMARFQANQGERIMLK